MDEKTYARYSARANIIKSLAHPTRLFMVDKLTEGAFCVAELAKLVGADVSTISKHLSILKESGIVGDEKRGTQVFYRLKTPCVLNFFTCCETVFKETTLARMELIEQND